MKVVLPIVLLSCAVMPCAAQTVTGSAQEPDRDAEERRIYESEVGRRLALCLVGECSVFVGTIRAVGQPVKESEEYEDNRAVFYTRLDVVVDEWLRARRERKIEVRLSYAAYRSRLRGYGPWDAWVKVKPQVGQKLLVGLWEGEAKKSRLYHGRVDEIAVVVSDEKLRTAVGELVLRHDSPDQDAVSLSAAPLLLDDKSDFAFGGYAVTLLERALNSRNADTIAMSLSKLLDSGDLTEISWFYATRTLLRAMLRSDAQIAAATRAAVAESLVKAGTGENAKMARGAIGTLALLVEGNGLDLGPSLEPQRRVKLVEGIRLYCGGAVGEARCAALRSQLGVN